MAKKIIMTHESEPVDLKSALAPTTGKDLKVDLSSYATVTSTEGNTFYVIGALPYETHTLRISVRLWKEASPKTDTVIGFRFRVGDMLVDGKPMVASDEVFKALTAATPYWTNAQSIEPTGHRSISGTLAVPVPAWEPKAVAQHCINTKFPAMLFEAMQAVLPDASFITLSNFEKMLTMLVCVILNDVVTPPPATNRTSLFFGKAAKPLVSYLNGNMVTGVLATPSPESSEPQKAGPGVPYAAPHPKDKAKTPV